MLESQLKRQRRHKRVRAKVFGLKDKPRLCVFRSASHIYAQMIDDDKRKTLFSANDNELKKKKTAEEKTEKDGKDSLRKAKIASAFEVGKLIAKKAAEHKIEKVAFDRGGYKYHGRVKALADGAREGGLKF